MTYISARITKLPVVDLVPYRLISNSYTKSKVDTNVCNMPARITNSSVILIHNLIVGQTIGNRTIQCLGEKHVFPHYFQPETRDFVAATHPHPV